MGIAQAAVIAAGQAAGLAAEPGHTTTPTRRFKLIGQIQQVERMRRSLTSQTRHFLAAAAAAAATGRPEVLAAVAAAVVVVILLVVLAE